MGFNSFLIRFCVELCFGSVRNSRKRTIYDNYLPRTNTIYVVLNRKKNLEIS